MMSSKKLLAVLALASALILDQVQAVCICTRIYFSLCQRYDMSDVVLHATASARNVTGDDATYTLDIITLYKAEGSDSYTDEISFTTPAATEDCGVTLTIGEEYLIGLIDPEGDGVFTVEYCHGLYETWSTAENEVAECEVDPCAGACGDYEECQLYEYDGNYYCSEICADGACDEGETCTTRERKWCRNSGFLGCPTRRKCS